MKKKILFVFLTDIQECYEVTLQQSAEQTIVKEDSRKDVWEVTFKCAACLLLVFVC